MKAPKYVESNIITIVKREQEYMNHLKKLNRVQSDPYLQRRPQIKSTNLFTKIRENKVNNKVFNDTAKVKQIYCENQKINYRILEILQRDTNRYSRSQGMIKEPRAGSASSVKSLNFSYRKKQAQTIATENNQLMGRLLQTSSSLKKDSMMREYEKQKTYKERISRISKSINSKFQSTLIGSSSSEIQMNSLRLKGTTQPINIKKQPKILNILKTRVSPRIEKLKLPPIR